MTDNEETVLEEEQIKTTENEEYDEDAAGEDLDEYKDADGSEDDE